MRSFKNLDDIKCLQKLEGQFLQNLVSYVSFQGNQPNINSFFGTSTKKISNLFQSLKISFPLGYHEPKSMHLIIQKSRKEYSIKKKKQVLTLNLIEKL